MSFYDPPYDIWVNNWEEDIADVALHFRIRRWCRLNGHEPPTVLEMVWIRRLKEVFTVSADFEGNLMQWARRYANREKVCKIGGGPIQADDLDYCLEYRIWEDRTDYDVAVKSLQIPGFDGTLDLVSDYRNFLDLHLYRAEQALRVVEDKLRDIAVNDPDPDNREFTRNALQEIGINPAYDEKNKDI